MFVQRVQDRPKAGECTLQVTVVQYYFPQIEIYYYPPKNQVLDAGARKKEAIRRRRSKMDQERYFEEFPHPRLSVCNFSYVRRPLGLNNEAYELVRETKSGLETLATRAVD